MDKLSFVVLQNDSALVELQKMSHCGICRCSRPWVRELQNPFEIKLSNQGGMEGCSSGPPRDPRRSGPPREPNRWQSDLSPGEGRGQAVSNQLSKVAIPHSPAGLCLGTFLQQLEQTPLLKEFQREPGLVLPCSSPFNLLVALQTAWTAVHCFLVKLQGHI